MSKTFARLCKISGTSADSGEVYDRGEEVFIVLDGEHANHVLSVFTAKHDCGAFEETHQCSCGFVYKNQMTGCWQAGHQRKQENEPFSNPSSWQFMMVQIDQDAVDIVNDRYGDIAFDAECLMTTHAGKPVLIIEPKVNY